jgi:hypothetical protein
VANLSLRLARKVVEGGEEKKMAEKLTARVGARLDMIIKG